MKPRALLAVLALALLLSPLAAVPASAASPAGFDVALATDTQPSVVPTPPAAMLGPLPYMRQTLNNCGPASVAEVLHYWGVERTQWQAQAVLRADGNPRGMAPYGVPAYVRSLGLEAHMGVAGNQALLKSLLANGFPVIVSQWVSRWDHTGHYRPLEGFDDARGAFIASDPYLGPDHLIGYDEFDEIWAWANQRFIVIYPPGKRPLLQAVLSAAGWDRLTAYQIDLAKQQERLANPQAVPAGYRRSFGWLALAWDNLELGRPEAAQEALRQALAAGASPIVVDWVAQAPTMLAQP